MIKRIAVFLFFVVVVLVVVFSSCYIYIQLSQGAIDREIEKTDYDYKNLRDPTYCEMKEFLARDMTNFNKANSDKLKTILGFVTTFRMNYYDCSNFTRDVKRNAIKRGIRCAGVFIISTDDRIHAIVAFQTTDKGVIFIEPLSDKEMEVAVGNSYFTDTIADFKIYWPRIKK